MFLEIYWLHKQLITFTSHALSVTHFAHTNTPRPLHWKRNSYWDWIMLNSNNLNKTKILDTFENYKVYTFV